jgi:hypothetical protein
MEIGNKWFINASGTADWLRMRIHTRGWFDWDPLPHTLSVSDVVFDGAKFIANGRLVHNMIDIPVTSWSFTPTDFQGDILIGVMRTAMLINLQQKSLTLTTRFRL